MPRDKLNSAIFGSYWPVIRLVLHSVGRAQEACDQVLLKGITDRFLKIRKLR